MQIYYLYYFKVIAETENMTWASEILNISQPALSKSIANLERELGVALFQRSKRRMQLSPIGREFYTHVAAAFDDISAGQACIERYKQNQGGSVTIGTTATEVLTPLIQSWFQDYPDSELQINQYIYTPEILREQLQKSGVDFAITGVPIYSPDIVQEKLMDEEILLVAALSHPISKSTLVRLEDCRNEKFLINDASFDRKAVTDNCRLVGFEPCIALCSNEPELIQTRLDVGQGVTMVPGSVFYEKHGKDDAVALRFSDVEIVRQITVANRKDCVLAGEAEIFYQYALDFYAAYGKTIATFLSDYFPKQEFGQRKTLGMNQPFMLMGPGPSGEDAPNPLFITES